VLIRKDEDGTIHVMLPTEAEKKEEL